MLPESCGKSKKLKRPTMKKVDTAQPRTVTMRMVLLPERNYSHQEFLEQFPVVSSFFVEGINTMYI